MNHRRRKSNGEEMTRCPKCQKLVPSHNFDLHQVRCRHVIAPSAPPLFPNNNNRHAPIYIDESPQRRGDRINDNNNNNNNNNNNGEVVCLIDDDDNEHYGGTAESNEAIEIMDDHHHNNNDTTTNNEWACTRCTLLNPNSIRICDACGLQRSGHDNNNYRNPDAVIRGERLIDDNYAYARSSNSPNDTAANFSSSNMGSVGGGAVLGGLIGGTSAFMRGESLTSGALNGIMTGAVGGAIAGELAREIGDFASRANTSVHASAPPATASDAPVRPVRFVRLNHQNRNSAAVGFGADQNAAMMEMMLRSMFAPGAMGVRGGNIDNMTYEQILEAFGDGSENRGADDEMIASLPSSTIRKVSNDCIRY